MLPSGDQAVDHPDDEDATIVGVVRRGGGGARPSPVAADTGTAAVHRADPSLRGNRIRIIGSLNARGGQLFIT